MERQYVTAKPIGPQGLSGQLFMAVRAADVGSPWLLDFVRTTRERTFTGLPGIALL